MTKFGKFLIIFLVLVLLGIVLFFLQKGPAEEVVAPEVEEPILTIENQMLGKVEDLVAFSVLPGQKVSGVLDITGSIKGGWFFEGNILVNVLNEEKDALLNTYGTAITDWQVIDPVEFETSIDFEFLPKGKAYIEIKNDNASGDPEFDKNVLIPVIIE